MQTIMTQLKQSGVAHTLDISVHLLRFPCLHLVLSRFCSQLVRRGKQLWLAAPLATHQTAPKACFDALQKVLFGDAKHSLK